MRFSRLGHFVVVGLMLVGLSSLAHATEAWRMQQEDQKNGQTVKSQLTIGEGKMRIDDTTRNVSVVIDFDQDTMKNVMHANKQCVTMKISDFSKQIDAMMEYMKKQGKMVEATYSLKNTQESQTVNGLPAKKLVILKDAKPEVEVWIAPNAGTKRIRDTYSRFYKLMGGKAGPVGQLSQVMTDAFNQGLPVKVVAVGEMKKEGRKLVNIQKIEKVTVDNAFFTVPADYQCKSMEEVQRQLMQMMGKPGQGGPGGVVPPQMNQSVPKMNLTPPMQQGQ